jgi:diguanylate cyclase (GGDEF)-like protein/PAS domain S-box-containing protein
MSMHESRKLSEDLESLKRQLAQLQSVVLDNGRTQSAPVEPSPPAEAAAAPSSLRAKIEQRLGYFPGFMAAAEAAPEVLEAFWHSTLACYLDNPLPELSKERLFARLARKCGAGYAAALHSCRLLQMGVSARTIRAWLEHPAGPQEADLERSLQLFPLNSRLTDWPEPGSELEHGLALCALALFDSGPAGPKCRDRIADSFGAEKLGQLLAFLAYVRSCLLWIAAGPAPSWDADPFIATHLPLLLREDPEIEKLLGEDPEAARDSGKDAQPAQNESHYRQFFDNARDLFLVHDSEGNLLQSNLAWEAATGHAEFPINLFEMLAPGAAEAARSDVKRLLAGEALGPREVELLVKQGERRLFEIHTTIHRHAEPFPLLQTVAREIAGRRNAPAFGRERELQAWAGDLEQRSRDMDMLSEMVDMLRACVTQDEVTMVAARVAQDVFPEQSGALYLIAQPRDIAEAAVVWGSPASARSFSLDECWSLRRARPHWVGEPQLGLLCKHVAERLPQSYLCVPMMVQLKAIGVLHLCANDKRALSESRRRLVTTMAQHISMALSNLELHERLLSQSIRDPLTGLFNRQFLEEALQLELSRATRSRQPLGVVLWELDPLDGLPRMNGRDAREAAVAELGRLVQAGVRKEDIASRYDTDKFIVVLAHGSGELVRQRAEALGESIRNADVKRHGQSLGRLSASAGIAVFPDHGRTVDELLSAARSALERARQHGANRILVSE